MAEYDVATDDGSVVRPLSDTPQRELDVWANESLRASLARGLTDSTEGRVHDLGSFATPTVLDLDDPYFDGQTLPDALADYAHVHSTTGVCVKNTNGPRCDPDLCAEHRDGKPGDPHEWRRGRRGRTRVVTCTPDQPPAPRQDERCQCPPCPGRGNDGHGHTHCAECCFGTGVEADPDCPIHGQPRQDEQAAGGVTLTEDEERRHHCKVNPQLCREYHFHKGDVERILTAHRDAADAEKDRRFGNLRWMDGHQQGLVDAKAEAEAERAALVEVAREAIDAIGTGGHGHWREGGAGGSCSACEAQTTARARLRAALAATTDRPER